MSTQTLTQGSLRPTRVPAIRSRYKISSAFLDNLLRPHMSVHRRADQISLLQRRTVVHPGLQVHSIAAPKTDRRLSFLMSANLYCAFAAGAVLVAQASPAITNTLKQSERPGVVIELRPPAENPRPVAVIARMPPTNFQPHLSVAPVITEPQPPVDTDTTPTTIGTHDLSPHAAGDPTPRTGPGGDPETWTPTGIGPTGPATGQPVEVSFKSVSILQQIQPAYPNLARLAHKEGDVVLIMTINEQGVPTEVKMDSGDAVFKNDAIRAAQQWRFTSALCDGKPHSARFRLTLQFRLRA